MAIEWVIALLAGAAVIAGLAFYAGRLLWQVKAQRLSIAKQQAEAQARLEESKRQRNSKLADSIHLIARAMKEKQCEYSEGCLRVWVLMSQYSFSQQRQLSDDFAGIFKMYDAVKEMPTHDARKKYSKKEIFKLDSARWRAEEQLEAEILADCEKLLVEFAPLPGSENVVFN